MSRKAKLPIAIPKGVEVRVENHLVTIKGAKGTLNQEVREGIVVKADDQGISVTLDADHAKETHFLGLYWSLIANMVVGVSQGYKKQLEMIGVGFRAAVQGTLLDLQIGISHPMKLHIPEGIQVTVEKNVMITVEGADKQKVGQFAADIRSKRRPEPYKGKGIRYVDEFVRRKQGKKAGK